MDTQKFKTQKYIKVGNSTAITVDSDYMRRENLTSGDEVVVKYTDDGVMIVIPKHVLAKIQLGDAEEKVQTLTSKITPELIGWTQSFVTENKEALEKLANL